MKFPRFWSVCVCVCVSSTLLAPKSFSRIWSNLVIWLPSRPSKQQLFTTTSYLPPFKSSIFSTHVNPPQTHLLQISCFPFWKYLSCKDLKLPVFVYPVFPVPSLSLPQISSCLCSPLFCASLSHPSCPMLPLLYVLCVSSHTSLDNVYKKLFFWRTNKKGPNQTWWGYTFN